MAIEAWIGSTYFHNPKLYLNLLSRRYSHSYSDPKLNTAPQEYCFIVDNLLSVAQYLVSMLSYVERFTLESEVYRSLDIHAI